MPASDATASKFRLGRFIDGMATFNEGGGFLRGPVDGLIKRGVFTVTLSILVHKLSNQ